MIINTTPNNNQFKKINKFFKFINKLEKEYINALDDFITDIVNLYLTKQVQVEKLGKIQKLN